MREHVINRLLQPLLAPALDRQPAVLHQPPHRLDTVELRAIGRQELELDVFLPQECERGPDGSSVMDGDVVEYDHKRFVDLAAQVLHKAQKGLGGAGLPVMGVHDSAAAEQRGHDIKALAAWSIDQVLLAAWRPSAAVGVNQSETGLVEVGQFDLVVLRSASQLVERSATVRWRSKALAAPIAASARQPPRRACAARRPLRGMSKNASMPSLAQHCQVTRTVSILRCYNLATSRLSRG